MTVHVRSRMTRLACRRAAGIAASCLLLVSGCSLSAASGGCRGGEKCPGPSLPAMTVHLQIGGQSASIGIGQTTHAFATRDVPTKITLSIDRTTRASTYRTSG